MQYSNNILEKFVGEKIALYGLGVETEKLLNQIGDKFDIVGLLDGYKQEGELFGKPIISLESAIKQDVRLILVVARPGSCRAIAKRIANICITHEIALYDIRGNNLCENKKVSYSFCDAEEITKEKLCSYIDEKDVICVDMFDTLVMRRTMWNTDVFDIVSEILKERNINIDDFSNSRLYSEKQLSSSGSPQLIKIYENMLSKYKNIDIMAEELAEIEWEIDALLLVQRKELCDILRAYSNKGKKIYIVTDTYYTKKQIQVMLEKCKIDFYDDIFVSCEYNTLKNQELFNVVKMFVGGESYIHIGDDMVSDIDGARGHGIQAVHICSGMDLFEKLGYLGTEEYIYSLSDKIKVGMFIANIFNSPFQFESMSNKVSIKSAYDIGYVLFAPMITDFVIWFGSQIENYNIKNIWFGARDGFLIKKMYDKMVNNNTSTYFLTSRMAAIRSGILSVQDLEYVQSMKFSGSVKEQLKERFGIELSENDALDNIMDYFEKIVLKSKDCQRNYLKYIDGIDIRDSDIAFFDFVAKGTTQLFIQKLIDKHIKGLYFLQLEKDNMSKKNIDIISFYDSDNLVDSSIFDNYYILETILTSDQPSVIQFDKNGSPIYAKETRKQSDIICFKEVQNGIYDYFIDFLELCPIDEVKINRKLDEIILNLIHGFNIEVEQFTQMQVEDPFFNRTTGVSDLI